MMILRSALSSSFSSSSSSSSSPPSRASALLLLLGRLRAGRRATTSKRHLATANTRGVASPAAAPRRRVRPTSTSTSSSTSSSSSSSSSADYLFTPSPFARSSRIIVDEEFAIVRELVGDPNNAYGARRYLLLPVRPSSSSSSSSSCSGGGVVGHRDANYSPDDVVASMNANRNVLFGARLHRRRGDRDDREGHDDDDDDDHDDGHPSRYLAACGALLDVAREDASINGQQVQALAALDGLCAYVSRCLERRVDDDHWGGSDVLAGLMTRGGAGGIAGGGREEVDDGATTRRTRSSSSSSGGKRAYDRPIITPSSLGIKNDSQRRKVLEAVRSIATGRPRPGRTVLGAGTYRDGMAGWTALALEYARLATTAAASSSSTYDDDADDAGVDSAASDESSSRRAGWGRPRGPLEVALYASRGGEVTKIEHLAHTTPEYLSEAGGAMARMFFV
ncbi:hypothetical protein ACHAW5_010559 [Stephanodiscus triporus]|uniref:Uncharacterized protein n=1 Tax=Stephanodiscus triporus TaxID=2934178 RepID=A0ABD3PLP2_9STRA